LIRTFSNSTKLAKIATLTEWTDAKAESVLSDKNTTGDDTMAPLPKYAELFYDLELTEEQQIYVDSIFDNQMTIVNARSGTGKTTLAVGAAHILDMPLVYTFSPVEEGSIGHTPGTVEEKERKYIQPLLDALHEIDVDPRFALKSENNPDMINEKAWVEAKSHT